MDTSPVTLHNLSIVVVVQHHSPSIIDPDFLFRNKIVQREQEIAEPPINGPAISRVVYKTGSRTGLEIVSEQNRISFSEKFGGAWDSIICPAVAKRYLEVVPYMNYTAVGINPVGVLSNPAIKFNVANLLKVEQGLQHQGVLPSASANINLTYKTDRRSVNITVVGTPDSGTAAMFNGNFHYGINQASESYKEATKFVDMWKESIKDFTEITKKIVENYADK